MGIPQDIASADNFQHVLGLFEHFRERPLQPMLRSRQKERVKEAHSIFRSRISHSHTMITQKPRRRRSRIARASRRRLDANFVLQNSVFAFGMVARRQLVWWCQKQPLTNIAHRRVLLAKSGEPGSERTFRRYDSPIERKHDATACSADVPKVGTRPIHSLRLGSMGFSRFIL